jgi:peptide-methionine (S)-S-oxide reductase
VRAASGAFSVIPAKAGIQCLFLALGFSAYPVQAGSAESEALATFAGGCFWCTEADFEKVPGVLSAVSGYTGGHVKNPDYQSVTTGRTGHTEAVQIRFDPAKVSYAQLLEIYWKSIDPTVKDRQFCDVGSQYRTGIYTHDDEQRRLAQESKSKLEASGRFTGPIYTEITAAGPFYVAEEYHQDYYRKNPLRYHFYRSNCGRDERLKELWGTK